MLKKKKLEFILFIGKENNFTYYEKYNFKDCINNLFATQKNVGFYAIRNPFNRNLQTYNAYFMNLIFKNFHIVLKKMSNNKIRNISSI